LAVPSSSVLSAFPTGRFGAIGQSLAAFLYYSHAGYAFKTKLAEILRGSGDAGLVAIANGGIEIAPYATGGSYASQLNETAVTGSDASVHWDDSGAGARGSVCQSAYERMDERVAGNYVQHLLADQGQADAAVAAGQTAISPPTGATNWYNAWVNLLGASANYREHLDNPATGKVIWALLGRTTSSSMTNSLGYHRIREKQVALIAADASTRYRFETWDLELGDSVHPSIVGQTAYGYRMAECVAKNVYGVTTYNGTTIYEGPTISSVSLAADDVTVSVVLASDTLDAISMPSRSGPPPCGFGFYDGSANMDAVFSTAGTMPPVQRPTGDWGWVSGSTKTLTFTLATPITGTIKLAFPFDNVSDFHPDLVISGSTSGKPLQTKFL
jgi:hypothetical protein